MSHLELVSSISDHEFLSSLPDTVKLGISSTLLQLGSDRPTALCISLSQTIAYYYIELVGISEASQCDNYVLLSLP